jgi:purine nucleoside permease
VRRILALFLASLLPLAAQAKPIVVKVVVLTTFESGASAGTGTRAGEFGLWADRLPLRHRLKVPGIEGRVLLSDDGVLGVVTGMRARPRESVTAIILDPELDVSHAYWIVAGIAGVDPRAGSIGSAAWARYVVDADPVFEMDDREIPKDWPEGLWSLGTDRPGAKGSAPGSSEMVWKLNPGLVNWAYALTRDTPLPDTADLKAARVDNRRVLVLRTASNYSREPDGAEPSIHFAHGGAGAAFEAAYRAGSPVVKALVAGWDQYVTTPPGQNQ